MQGGGIMNEFPASYLCTNGTTMQGVMHYPTSMAPGYPYFTPGKHVAIRDSSYAARNSASI